MRRIVPDEGPAAVPSVCGRSAPSTGHRQSEDVVPAVTSWVKWSLPSG